MSNPNEPLPLIHREDIPAVAPVLPLRNAVLFPGGVLPIAVGKPESIQLVRDAVRDNKLIVLVAQRHAEQEEPGYADLYECGCVAKILKLVRMPEGTHALEVQGLERVRLSELTQALPYRIGRIEAVALHWPLESLEPLGEDIRQLALDIVARIGMKPAASQLCVDVRTPVHLADLVTVNLIEPLATRQELLETLDVMARIKRLRALLGVMLAAAPALAAGPVCPLHRRLSHGTCTRCGAFTCDACPPPLCRAASFAAKPGRSTRGGTGALSSHTGWHWRRWWPGCAPGSDRRPFADVHRSLLIG